LKNRSLTWSSNTAHARAAPAPAPWTDAPDDPIDVVYLWVDGNDANWRARRAAALAALSEDTGAAMALHANVEGRFRDNQELRYSLRSLERFFPQHGHIYIVTDGQAPDWLRPSDRLTLVDHRELIPAAHLPTFDSGHIESWIHHIPGLSERYFYFNDDVFLGAPLDPADWFTPEGFYVTWSDEPNVTDEPMRTDATALDNACRLSIEWLRAQDAAYQGTFRTFAHSPRPMRRSMLMALESIAPALFAMVRSTVFRCWDKPTIVSDFVLRWALAQGWAQVRDYRHHHVPTGDAHERSPLQTLAAEFGTLDFFCINDTTDNAHANDPRLLKVQALLQALLPQASGFEQGGGKIPAPVFERPDQAAFGHPPTDASFP
jgi:hypothetical protein